MNKILFLSLFFVVGCSTTAKIHHVEIIKKQYIPSEISINKGDTVIWINKEKRQYHNVWFKQFDTKEPDYIFPDETFEKTFDTSGEHPYECGPHPKMTGVVKVE